MRRAEMAEQRGVINLDTLVRMADALGCDVRYNLVPRGTLQDQVRARAEELAREQVGTAGMSDAELERVGEEFELTVRNLMACPRRSFW